MDVAVADSDIAKQYKHTNMKKILSIMTAAMLGTAVSAQETYDNAPLAQKDLNGTARYVGTVSYTHLTLPTKA